MEDKKVYNKTGKIINCEYLNFREEPNIDSNIATILPKEMLVKINNEIDGFYEVIINEKTLYAMTSYIDIITK